MNWKDTTKIENSDRKKILDHIDNLMKKRVEAIMGANRRNYYGDVLRTLLQSVKSKKNLVRKMQSRFICHIMRICIQGEVPLNQN